MMQHDSTWCNRAVSSASKREQNSPQHASTDDSELQPESFPCTFRSSDPDLAIVHMGGGPQKNFLAAMDMAKVGPSVGSLGGTVCPLWFFNMTDNPSFGNILDWLNPGWFSSKAKDVKFLGVHLPHSPVVRTDYSHTPEGGQGGLPKYERFTRWLGWDVSRPYPHFWWWKLAPSFSSSLGVS